MSLSCGFNLNHRSKSSLELSFASFLQILLLITNRVPSSLPLCSHSHLAAVMSCHHSSTMPLSPLVTSDIMITNKVSGWPGLLTLTDANHVMFLTREMTR